MKDAYLDVIGKLKVKWKREVICCACWSSSQCPSLNDLPDLNYSFKQDTLATQCHWNRAAALYTHSWPTREIPKDKELKCAYEKILENKNMN